MKGEWVWEKLMRNWLSFDLKSLQKSVYVPCSEKNEGSFFCEQERRRRGGGGGGSVEERGHMGISREIENTTPFPKSMHV